MDQFVSYQKRTLCNNIELTFFFIANGLIKTKCIPVNEFWYINYVMKKKKITFIIINKLCPQQFYGLIV